MDRDDKEEGEEEEEEEKENEEPEQLPVQQDCACVCVCVCVWRLRVVKSCVHTTFSRSFLYVTGLLASRTIKISVHVRAVPITRLPRPLPSFAPSMMPGKSSCARARARVCV